MRAIALWTGFTSTNYTYSCMDHAPLHEMLNFTLYLCYYMLRIWPQINIAAKDGYKPFNLFCFFFDGTGITNSNVH